MDDRSRARDKALRAAVAVTLGLATLGSIGCGRVIDVACETFDQNRYCCDRRGWNWNESTRTCSGPIVIPGPFVPPDLPV